LLEARLVVTSGSIPAEEITARIGIPPTETLAIGDRPTPEAKSTYREHGWILLIDTSAAGSSDDSSLDSDQILCRRLSGLGPVVSSGFRSLVDEGARVELVLFEDVEADDWQSGPWYRLSSDAVTWLADARAAISVSITLPDR